MKERKDSMKPEIVEVASLTATRKGRAPSEWNTFLPTVEVGKAFVVTDERQIQNIQRVAKILGLGFSKLTTADGKIYMSRLAERPAPRVRKVKATVETSAS